MSLRLLRTLVAVSDAKTFSAAAQIVHVTHAAVSQQMKALEAELGVTLFDRSTRTPELTPLAHRIVARARDILSAYDNLVPAALEEDGLTGTMTLGVLRTTLTGLTPRALAALKSRFPELGLHIRPGLTSSLLGDVERGTVDAAILSKPHLLPAGLVFRDIAYEPMTLIAAQQEQETDPIQLLKTRPFIRFDRSAVIGTLIDNWIRTKRITVNETMELDSPEAIASMVQANLGVSIVPDLVIKPQHAVPVRQLDLGASAPRRILSLVHRENTLRPRAMDALQEALVNVIAQAAPDRLAL